jgi:hypothetical protein
MVLVVSFLVTFGPVMRQHIKVVWLGEEGSRGKLLTSWPGYDEERKRKRERPEPEAYQ